MNGKFFIGVLSGAVLISGAFVVGSVMFPVEDGTEPVEVANAPDAPVATATAPKSSSEVTTAGEPALAAAEPVLAPEPEPAPDPAVVLAPEPAPDPAPAPLAETAPETAPEADPAKASTPPLPEAETQPEAPVQADMMAEPPAAQGAEAPAKAPGELAAAVSETLPEIDAPTAEVPATIVADGVTSDGTAPTVAAGALASAEPAASETVPAADPSPASDPALQGTGETPPVALALAEPPASEPAVEPAAEPATESAPAAPAPAEAAEQPQPPAVPDLPDADTTDAAKAPPPLPETVQAAPAILPDPVPEAAADPVIEVAEVVPEAAAPVAEAPVPDAPADEPLPQADGMVPGPDDPAGKASDPGAAPEVAPKAEEAPQPDEATEAELPAPDADPLPETAGEALSDSTFTPTPGLGDDAGGVVIGRLPRIGDAPAAESPAADAPVVTDAIPEVDNRPITAFAATFENPDAKPLVALVLIDAGMADLDRAGLAALPFPVSFALDPLDPATPERAAIYRAAGKEVVMLATGIAEGAQASDIEVAFQSMAQGLPEAVAVMDLAEPMFQDRRPLASIVVPVVAAQGRGLLTWDQGLNAADQVARREDVAAAVVFRDLASAGTDSESVRRLLDRAVFKAGQDGRVAVAGEATPDLVAALLEWTVEGRAATVALAPLTAVLTVE